MHRLVPEFIQEQYRAEQGGGSFDAGALFVDLSGFTAITEALMGRGRHGAEILANIIRNVFDPLMQSVFEQGGFVTNLAGDAFTAVFPTEGESPEAFARALAAAWHVQKVMAASAQHRTSYGNFVVSVKVGLAAGEVAWGILSSTAKSRAAYYFQGSAIDGCAQAEKLAEAGEVIVDAAVRRALGVLVSAEPREDHFHITGINGILPSPQPVNLRPVETDILVRFFPPEATRPTLSGEFRQVVSTFVSLPTVRTAEQLEIFLQIIFDLQDRYGGLLNRLDFGDKGANLLLFWGAPVAHENDVMRALNFILDLQSQTVIPVNAGITYRIAHGGYSGGALAGEYTCHGRGITLAARFMQASPRGEVWVDENVAKSADPHFEVDFEGEMAFKGFAQEQKVFVLLERKEDPKPFFRGEMVGRQDEQTSLGAFVQPIWQGRHPGIMVIWGEPGIGKSRLVHGFLDHLENSIDQGFSVFICQTDEILRESLNPFRYWLLRYFGQSEQQSNARNKRSFNRKLDDLIAATGDETLLVELDRTRSFLGALVNLDWPDSLYEQLDAQGRYENSITGLLTLLKAESFQQPVILILEDAHWLDGDSKAFLRQFGQALAKDQTYPIVILATARQEGDRTILGDNFSYQEIDLSQMSSNDLAMLARNQLGSPISPDLLKLLVERAEGNPFFAEQILRYLQEQALLQLVGEEWALKSEQATALPSDVSAVLVARLDRLTHEVKDVVQTASVLGREFEIRLLTHMLRDDPTVRGKVEQAVQLSIWSALNELRYLFKHALLRDAAYRMQVRSRRQSLHKLATEALEDLYEDDLSPHYGELAYHAEQAHLIVRARHYLELAGEIAGEAYHNSLAVDYFSRALKLTPDEDMESRYRLLRAREKLYDVQGARQKQSHDLNEMAELAELLEDVSKQVEVVVRRAWLFYWKADYSEALKAAQRASTLAESASEQGSVGQARYARAWALFQLGIQDEARHSAQEALAVARKAGDSRATGNSLNILGMISLAEGDYYAAQGHLHEFLVNSQELKDWEREAAALGNLGVVFTFLGQYAAAQDYFERSLKISREIGSRKWTVSESINLSWVGTAQGDWQSAVKHGEAGLAIARETKWAEMEAEALIWIGHAWLGLGQLQKAFAAYEKSLKARRELGQEHLAMGVLAGMARAALVQNDLVSASGYAAEIVSYLEGGGSLDGTWEPLRIYLTCYQVLQALQDSRASAILETANQQLQEQASKIPDLDARRLFLENVPWNREIVAAHQKLFPPQ
jgi:predicted ATPase/class 3 adenylate cyclase